MRQWLYGLGAFLLGFGLYLLGRDGRAARRADDRLTDLLATDTTKNLDRAEKEAKKAEAAKARAEQAAEVTRKKLEQIRDKDTDMGDLLAAFDAERVRQQSG